MHVNENETNSYELFDTQIWSAEDDEENRTITSPATKEIPTSSQPFIKIFLTRRREWDGKRENPKSPEMFERDRKIIVFSVSSLLRHRLLCRSDTQLQGQGHVKPLRNKDERWERRKDGNDLVISWLESVFVSHSVPVFFCICFRRDSVLLQQNCKDPRDEEDAKKKRKIKPTADCDWLMMKWFFTLVHANC